MSGVRADEAHRFARTDRIAAAPRYPVDLSDPIEADNAFRIAVAWRELRRCATTPALRYQFFGSSHDALEQGQMDTLDLLLIRDGWRMSELAEALRVDPSTATQPSSVSSTTAWRSVGRAPTTGASCSDYLFANKLSRIESAIFSVGAPTAVMGISNIVISGILS